GWPCGSRKWAGGHATPERPLTRVPSRPVARGIGSIAAATSSAWESSCTNCLAGRPPFRADSPAELLERVANHEPRPLRLPDEGIPKERERICFKALSKRASERYLTAQDMADDLRHFLAGQTSPGPGTVAKSSTTPVVAASSTGAGSVIAATPSISDHPPVK